jgi:predicted nucleic acid-binding protein
MKVVSNSTPLIALSRINKLIDEGDGRRIAESLGLKITGTVGILLLASADGKLDFKKTIDELIAVGFRLSEKEYKRILSLNKTLSYKL